MNLLAEFRRTIEHDGPKIAMKKTLRLAKKKTKNAPLYVYNSIHRGEKYLPPTDSDTFQEILTHSQIPTDMSDHLDVLFAESLLVQPTTIVELGVRGGESTFAFERVSRRTGADLVSVDIEDCSGATDYSNWHFVQADDVEFAGRFESWCEDRNIDPEVDVLFIDTSHLYSHTLEEIRNWFPHLSRPSIAFLHDTNLTPYGRHKNGTLCRGWDNDRGVIRALEDYLDCSFRESEQFTTIHSDFVIKHYPYSHGLTVLHRPSDNP